MNLPVRSCQKCIELQLEFPMAKIKMNYNIIFIHIRCKDKNIKRYHT